MGGWFVFCVKENNLLCNDANHIAKKLERKFKNTLIIFDTRNQTIRYKLEMILWSDCMMHYYKTKAISAFGLIIWICKRLKGLKTMFSMLPPDRYILLIER